MQEAGYPADEAASAQTLEFRVTQGKVLVRENSTALAAGLVAAQQQSHNAKSVLTVTRLQLRTCSSWLWHLTLNKGQIY